jgi:sigma-B regulation protein RsbU (phosphoserine phosphatase)
VLVVFSDGVTEALNAEDVEFGEERLLECADRSRIMPPSAFLTCLFDTVGEFTASTPPNDDRTAIVLRYNGV